MWISKDTKNCCLSSVDTLTESLCYSRFFAQNREMLQTLLNSSNVFGARQKKIQCLLWKLNGFLFCEHFLLLLHFYSSKKWKKVVRTTVRVYKIFENQQFVQRNLFYRKQKCETKKHEVKNGCFSCLEEKLFFKLFLQNLNVFEMLINDSKEFKFEWSVLSTISKQTFCAVGKTDTTLNKVYFKDQLIITYIKMSSDQVHLSK